MTCWDPFIPFKTCSSLLLFAVQVRHRGQESVLLDDRSTETDVERVEHLYPRRTWLRQTRTVAEGRVRHVDVPRFTRSKGGWRNDDVRLFGRSTLMEFLFVWSLSSPLHWRCGTSPPLLPPFKTVFCSNHHTTGDVRRAYWHPLPSAHGLYADSAHLLFVSLSTVSVGGIHSSRTNETSFCLCR